jgi:hypothetical protein
MEGVGCERTNRPDGIERDFIGKDREISLPANGFRNYFNSLIENPQIIDILTGRQPGNQSTSQSVNKPVSHSARQPDGH